MRRAHRARARRAERRHTRGGRIGTGTGRYVLYNGGTPGSQRVADFPRGATAGGTALDRTRTAAAVWGQRLWTPGGTQGTVVVYDLKAKKNVATVDTGAPCTPSEIQAVNAWLYWSCGSAGPAGVYDRAANRAITVPSGQARLADGYLVRENRTTHELLLTDFHTGTGDHPGRGRAAHRGPEHRRQYRPLGGRPARRQRRLPHGQASGGDRHGGRADLGTRPDGGTDRPAAGRPHHREPLAARVAAEQALHMAADAEQRLRHRRAHLTGVSTAAAVRPAWGARTDSGAFVPSGTYTGKLTAEPRDGQGPALALTGTTTAG
ncbi:hypothetical protein ACFTY8_20800 [Streptomyces mirabilis]|uniref:hypothetical protein n=1 Tax=Streptomyces mirabilis TaxID=68239 RepID=UPI003632F329